MTRELNKIFDVKTREARRRILDKFDISNEDKNEVLNKIEEGGTSDGGDSNIEYLDVRGLDSSVVAALKGFGLEVRAFANDSIIVAGTYCSTLLSGIDLAVSIDFNKEVIYNSQKVTVLDALIANIGETVDEEYFDSIPRITKEEFYNFEDNIIQFTIDTRNHCIAEEGMTFEQWVNSSYNTIGVYIEDDEVYLSSTQVITRNLNKVIEDGVDYDVAYIDNDGDADFN